MLDFSMIYNLLLIQKKKQDSTGMVDGTCYINGRFVSVNNATIPVTDLAIMRGYGVFDTLRTYGGRPFRMEDHLNRLERSADLTGLTLPWSRTELNQVILSTLQKNNYPEANIRIIVTGGESEDFFTPTGTPSLIVMVTPLHSYPEHCYKTGAKVVTAKIERYLSEAKTINYTSGEVAMNRAKIKDPDIIEVLCVDRNERVTEGITSNVFIFLGDTLITPGSNILLGITRQVVLELAEPFFQIEERDLFISELHKADDIFITGSTKEIMPVTRVDGLTVGDGGCGPNTLRLIDSFEDMKNQFISNQER